MVFTVASTSEQHKAVLLGTLLVAFLKQPSRKGGVEAVSEGSGETL